jgi:hypothetical protein
MIYYLYIEMQADQGFQRAPQAFPPSQRRRIAFRDCRGKDAVAIRKPGRGAGTTLFHRSIGNYTQLKNNRQPQGRRCRHPAHETWQIVKE